MKEEAAIIKRYSVSLFLSNHRLIKCPIFFPSHFTYLYRLNSEMYSEAAVHMGSIVKLFSRNLQNSQEKGDD